MFRGRLGGTVTSLRDRIVGVGRDLPEDLAREVAGGDREATVPILIDIPSDESLRDGDSPGEGWAPIHAMRLLAELGASEAVPHLLRIPAEEHWDTIIADQAWVILPKFGALALEPAIDAYDEDGTPSYRAALCVALSELGVKDERIHERLVESFPYDQPLIAGAFATYGDARALPLLSDALDDASIDEEHEFADPIAISEIAHTIEHLGGTLRADQRTLVEATRAASAARAEEFRRVEARREREYGELRRLLRRRDGMSFEGVRGLIAALASGPELAPPSTWLPMVLGNHPLNSKADAQALLEPVMFLFNDTLEAFEGLPARICPDTDDEAATAEWCAGYVAGIKLDATWLADAEAMRISVPLFVFAGEIPSDELEKAMPGKDIAKWKHDMREYLPDLVLRLHLHWEPTRAAVAEAMATGTVRSGPKIGRNDPCPCGSGKKHKRCCGARA